ncbi:MAG: hypothetical protein AB8B94_11960 [Hyphomicrobiales bacterium]
MRRISSKIFAQFHLKYVALLLAILLTSGQPAVGFDVCQTYGHESAAQQNKNIENGCGFSGLRWHTDSGAHEAYCKIFGATISQQELLSRQALLAPCLAAAAPADEDADALPADEDADAFQADEDADAVPEPQDEQVAQQCLKSEIAAGQGRTTQAARGAARDDLGLPRAQMINQGYNQCQFNDLGCTGNNGARTCYLSVNCCK